MTANEWRDIIIVQLLKRGRKMKNTIKTLRDNLGMTQDQLAQKLDVTQGAVAQWEAGLSKPEIGRLPKLAKVLGVTVDDLLREPTNQAS